MPKPDDKNNNEKRGFWFHFRGVLDESWAYLLGLLVVILLIVWIIAAHTGQIKSVFGFFDWHNIRTSTYAFIKQGFEPIKIPKESTKIPDAKCRAPEGRLCYPAYR